MSYKHLLPAILIAAALNGCASPTEVRNMAVNDTLDLRAIAGSTLHKSMEAAPVEGGSGTNPLWTSQVGNEDFQEALKISLKNHDFLSDSPNARYKLNAKLLTLKQPLIGFNLTVKTTVNYNILDTQTNKQVFEETIQSSYTASPSDTILAVKRLRLANEGAIKTNIEMLLKKIQEFSKKTTT